MAEASGTSIGRCKKALGDHNSISGSRFVSVEVLYISDGKKQRFAEKGRLRMQGDEMLKRGTCYFGTPLSFVGFVEAWRGVAFE